MIPTILVDGSGVPIKRFQSRNRETYDSNYHIDGWLSDYECVFQSRNRETYDSNFLQLPQAYCPVRCFNLVIEKLMIPTQK